jgi:integrase
MSRSGQVKKDEKAGGYYFVVDTAAPGEPRRQLKRRYKTYREARAGLTAVLHEVNSGTHVTPSKTTLRAFVEAEWLPVLRTQVRASTYSSYERNLRLHVLPALGDRQLQALKSTELTALYAKLLLDGRADAHAKGKGLSVRSVRYVHTILRACLQHAVDGDVLPRNPADKAKPPVQSAAGNRHETIHAWTGPELSAFLTRTTHQRHHVAWHLLAMTGMRRGEVLGLAWDLVDLDAGTVSVRRTLVDVLAGGVPVWSDPKTDRGRRLISLDAGTVAKLRAHRKAQAEERLLIGAGYRDLGLVFAMPDGRPVHPERFSREFAQTVTRSGLPVIRLHDLRHTWATLALQSGIHPKVVQERLGHSNISITLDIYSHVNPAMQTDAAERVAALVGGTA